MARWERRSSDRHRGRRPRNSHRCSPYGTAGNRNAGVFRRPASGELASAAARRAARPRIAACLSRPRSALSDGLSRPNRIDLRRPHRSTSDGRSPHARPRRLEASKLPPVNTNATRMFDVTRRRDTSSGTPSGRGKRRAGIPHRPAGRRWRAPLKTLRIDRNGRVTLPCRAGTGSLRQAPLVSPLFPELYSILFALLAETA